MIQREAVQERAGASFLAKVYGRMSLGLLLTFLTSFVVSNTSLIYRLIYSRGLFMGFIFAELALVWYMSARVHKMSMSQLTLGMVVYAIINGITLSIIFILYTGTSVMSTFFVTAGMFGALAIYGTTTDRDLSNMGSIMMMGLIGVIIASLVNIFLKSSAIYWIITYAGVIIFTGLTAYDSQKIKAIGERGGYSGEDMNKMAMMGALSLYLDFVNLFLFLLRILGRKK